MRNGLMDRGSEIWTNFFGKIRAWENCAFPANHFMITNLFQEEVSYD